MKKTKITAAAIAAVMAMSMVGGVSASADFMSADNANGFNVVEGGENTLVDELRGKFIEAGYSISDDDFVYSEVDGGVVIHHYVGYEPKIVIPAEINGKEVLGLENYRIPGEYGWETYTPFWGLTIVDEVEFEAPLTNLETSFVSCVCLRKVTLPKTLVTMMEPGEDGSYAFADCRCLEEVNFPKSFKYIDGEAFACTPWLDNQKGLVIVGKTLLSGKNAKGNVTIPNKVEWISSSAFYNNDNITELTIPARVKMIESCAIGDCDSLRKLTIRNGVKNNRTDLRVCGKLQKVIIPPSFGVDSTINLLGYDWMMNKRPTYYYYNDTMAANVLDSDAYSSLKKSVLPGKTSKVTVSAGKRTAKVTWKKVSFAEGYEVVISSSKTFSKGFRVATIKNNNTTTRTFKNLKKGKKYYVHMRTYKTIDHVRYYGNYTKTKTITVK